MRRSNGLTRRVEGHRTERKWKEIRPVWPAFPPIFELNERVPHSIEEEVIHAEIGCRLRVEIGEMEGEINTCVSFSLSPVSHSDSLRSRIALHTRQNKCSLRLSHSSSFPHHNNSFIKHLRISFLPFSCEKGVKENTKEPRITKN